MAPEDDARDAACGRALPAAAPARRAPLPLPLHRARELTGGGDLARIALDEQIYTLRITRAGKLILTK